MIIQAEPRHIDEIMEIWMETNQKAHSFIDETYWETNYKVVKEDYLPYASTYIYMEEERILGFISVMEDVFITALFVRTEDQNRGVGRQLLCYCQNLYKTLRLKVFAKNRLAVRFYRSCGFIMDHSQMDPSSKEVEFVMDWKRAPKVHDISKDFFSATVYPGDPKPEKETISSFEKGDSYRLTRIVAGSHQGTHIDAPSHFLPDGKTMDQIDLDSCIGPCKVVELEGVIGAEEIEPVLMLCHDRLLIKGEVILTEEGAKKIAQYGIKLLGVEGQTVGKDDEIAKVHKTLLSKEVVILESLTLEGVPEGTYFLSATPLKYEGLDGAPCRPVLVEID
ncbi:MAG TPA: N-acetyltransferase [Candidatus Merdenecus merdavium]|nr:N-acetyltransferase [Candidatus Merdenecus merdavium]